MLVVLLSLPLSLSLSLSLSLCFTRTLLSLDKGRGWVLGKRRATRDARAAVRLHCVERYVNMSTQLGYLPFLRRQFQVNSPNWLLSMLCLRVRRYVSLYRPRCTLPSRIHTIARVHVHSRTRMYVCARRVFLESWITLSGHDARMETRPIVR